MVELLTRPYIVEKQVAKAEGFVKQMKARHEEAQLVLRKLKSSRSQDFQSIFFKKSLSGQKNLTHRDLSVSSAVCFHQSIVVVLP